MYLLKLTLENQAFVLYYLGFSFAVIGFLYIITYALNDLSDRTKNKRKLIFKISVIVFVVISCFFTAYIIQNNVSRSNW